MSSAALGIGLPSIDSTRPVTQVVSPSTVAPLVKSAPYSNSGAPCAKNGPSTVASVAPGGVLWLSATTIMDRPRMSESRMNSWRLSSHFWPTAVRNLMPSNHSSSVSCTSRAKPCRCFTALAMICLKRGWLASLSRASTASVSVSSVNWRMANSSFRGYGASVLSKAPVRLVTFTLGNTPPRAGALLEGDRRLLDLQAAYSRVYHGSSPLLESVLAMVDAGAEAL